MKIKMHGATKEVGRSCIEVTYKTLGSQKRFLFDSGVKIDPKGMFHPSNIEKVNELDAVFISHAHLDHTGHLPNLLHEGLDCPIFCTAATKDTAQILLEDAHKIEMSEHEHPGYDQADIEKVSSMMKPVNYLAENRVSPSMISKFYDAGHIPGSSSILVNAEGKNILYTGDIKTESTLLLKGADTNYQEPVDVLIIESTYGGRNHPSREESQKRFLDAIRSTLSRGGSVVVPVFAVGRAQEIIMLLDKEEFDVPLYFEGMSKKVTRHYLGMPSYLRDATQLQNAFKKARFLMHDDDRRAAMQEQGIFVSTSGMMTGGPVLGYLEELGRDKKNSILMTGYQAEETNGRFLMEKGFVYVDSKRIDIKASYEQFDFSAHSGMDELRGIIAKTKPKVTIINHGDPEEALALGNFAKKVCKEVYVPEMDDEIEI